MRTRGVSIDPNCPHGTVRGYKQYSCGCDDCTEANRLDQQYYRAMRRKASGSKPEPNDAQALQFK